MVLRDLARLSKRDLCLYDYVGDPSCPRGLRGYTSRADACFVPTRARHCCGMQRIKNVAVDLGGQQADGCE